MNQVFQARRVQGLLERVHTVDGLTGVNKVPVAAAHVKKSPPHARLGLRRNVWRAVVKLCTEIPTTYYRTYVWVLHDGAADTTQRNQADALMQRNWPRLKHACRQHIKTNEQTDHGKSVNQTSEHSPEFHRTRGQMSMQT